MPKTVIRMKLSSAITSLLGRKKDPLYRDIGHNFKVEPLYKLLGLKGSPMLYHYMSGKTDKIEPERALVIFEKFNILIDEWEDEEELRRDAVNTEFSKQIAREPMTKVMELLVELESAMSMATMKRGIRKILAKYY